MADARPDADFNGALPPAFSPQEWKQLVRYCGLSPRQAEIVGLVMQSRPCGEIMQTLDISESTFRTQLDRAKARLAARDRVGITYQMFSNFRRMQRADQRPDGDGK